MADEPGEPPTGLSLKTASSAEHSCYHARALALPGALHGFVVARLPRVAAHDAPLDVVADQLFGVAGGLPGHDHGGVCVSGGHNFPRG